jgi:reactive intermediate/imine deaminase
MPKEFLNPENVFQPDFFSQAVKTGNTVYVSGMVGYDEEKNLVGKDDIGAQAAQAFENMKRVLESAGASMSDIVKMTFYFRSIDDSMNIAEAFMQYIQPPFPAMVGVEISRLQETELLIEVDAIAVID